MCKYETQMDWHLYLQQTARNRDHYGVNIKRKCEAGRVISTPVHLYRGLASRSMRGRAVRGLFHRGSHASLHIIDDKNAHVSRERTVNRLFVSHVQILVCRLQNSCMPFVPAVCS
jgi:hypothetical protein